MPDTSPAGTPEAARSSELPIGAAASTASGLKVTKGTPTSSRTPGWLGFIAIAIALCALGLAIAAWFRPTPGPSHAHPAASPPTFTAQQIADAKTKVCEAYTLVHQAVSINTNRQNPIPGDEIGKIAVAAHARLALYGGGSYLLETLSSEPATPKDLAGKIYTLAGTLEELSMNSLADSTDSTTNILRNTIDLNFTNINQFCK